MRNQLDLLNYINYTYDEFAVNELRSFFSCTTIPKLGAPFEYRVKGFGPTDRHIILEVVHLATYDSVIVVKYSHESNEAITYWKTDEVKELLSRTQYPNLKDLQPF
ncbi:hypothetical protein V7056_10740 [Bacillus sp. JJ664]